MLLYFLYNKKKFHHMKTSLISIALLFCTAAATEPEQRFLTHESPEIRALAEQYSQGIVGMDRLLQADEHWLRGQIAEQRLALPEGFLEPDLHSLLHRLKDNLSCQLYIAERQQKVGTCTAERKAHIIEKFADVGISPRMADSRSFGVYVCGMEARTSSELTQHLLDSIRKNGLMDWLTALELEEQLLRIDIEGIRDFNLTAEGTRLREKLRENLEQQLKLAEERTKAGVAPTYERMLLREKLERWGKEPSAMDAFLHHPSEQVRRIAEQILQGTADWATLLQADERWLLGEIAASARANRPLSPEEAGLQQSLNDLLARKAELQQSPDAAAHEQELRALGEEEETLRTRLTWYPAGDAELVAQLRRNLRCRLALAEKALQDGTGTRAAVEELQAKLALCPRLSETDEQPDAPADTQELLARTQGSPEQPPYSLVQLAQNRYNSGKLSFINELESQASLLHIRIFGQIALPYLQTEKIPLLERLESNLQRQLSLAQAMLDNGCGDEAYVLALREKLATWFSK